MKSHFRIFIFLFYIAYTYAKYSLPDLTIQAFTPKGVKITMPVTKGEEVQLFAFHANIDRQIRGKEQGDISRSATRPQNGEWTLEDKDIKLEVGQKLHYWVFAQSSRLGFDKEDQVFEIRELSENRGKCPESETKVNNNDGVCANEIILEDNFRDDKLNLTTWDVLKYTPQYALPGREFVTYQDDSDCLYVRNNILTIKPKYRGNRDDLPFNVPGCTDTKHPGACEISGDNPFEIPPPVVSAKIKSKVAFKYGRVEITAKLPIGDWLVPHLALEPRDYQYGDGFSSGALYMAYTRGNPSLTKGDEEIGANNIFFGPALSADRSKHMIKVPTRNPWGQDFRVYSIEWSSTEIIYRIDNKEVRKVSTPSGGFASLESGLSYAYKWKTKNAPFDQYFHLTIGLSVGGVIDFPDGVMNDGRAKPWKNTAPKAPIDFDDKKDEWRKSWNEESTLKIQSIKIYAI